MKNIIITKEFEEINNFISEIEKDKNQIDSNPLKEFYEKYDKICKESSKKVESYRKDRLNLMNSYNKKHNIPQVLPNNEETGKPVYGYQGNGVVQAQVNQNSRKHFHFYKDDVLTFFHILFMLIPIAMCISFSIYCYFKFAPSNNAEYIYSAILISYPSVFLALLIIFDFNDLRFDYHFLPFLIGIIYIILSIVIFIYAENVYYFFYNFITWFWTFFRWVIFIGLTIFYFSASIYIIEEFY